MEKNEGLLFLMLYNCHQLGIAFLSNAHTQTCKILSSWNVLTLCRTDLLQDNIFGSTLESHIASSLQNLHQS